MNVGERQTCACSRVQHPAPRLKLSILVVDQPPVVDDLSQETVLDIQPADDQPTAQSQQIILLTLTVLRRCGEGCSCSLERPGPC